jgi:hypothetical protein
MELIQDIKSKLDSLFDINKLDRDPAFSWFLPTVYDSIGFDFFSGLSYNGCSYQFYRRSIRG